MHQLRMPLTRLPRQRSRVEVHLLRVCAVPWIAVMGGLLLQMMVLC